MIIILIMIIKARRNDLSLPIVTSCVCPGYQLMYECTIVGSAIQYTVWKGSALDCNSEVSYVMDSSLNQVTQVLSVLVVKLLHILSTSLIAATLHN